VIAGQNAQPSGEKGGTFMKTELHGKIGDGFVGLKGIFDSATDLGEALFKLFSDAVHVRSETVIFGQLLQPGLGDPGKKK